MTRRDTPDVAAIVEATIRALGVARDAGELVALVELFAAHARAGGAIPRGPRQRMLAEALARYQRSDDPATSSAVPAAGGQRPLRLVVGHAQRTFASTSAAHLTERVAQFLDSPAFAGKTVSSMDLATRALGCDPGRVDRSLVTRIGCAMRKLGWHKREFRSQSQRFVYERPQKAAGVANAPAEGGQDVRVSA